MLKSRFFCADHELQILHVHVHVLVLFTLVAHVHMHVLFSLAALSLWWSFDDSDVSATISDTFSKSLKSLRPLRKCWFTTSHQ